MSMDTPQTKTFPGMVLIVTTVTMRPLKSWSTRGAKKTMPSRPRNRPSMNTYVYSSATAVLLRSCNEEKLTTRADEFAPLHVSRRYVLPLGRLADPPLSLRQCITRHLRRDRRFNERTLGVDGHWLPYSQCCSVPVRGRAVGSGWSQMGCSLWPSYADSRARGGFNRKPHQCSHL
jgi:hypothetical protein